MTTINEIGKIYTRPWGTYQTLALGEGYQVKIITVNPGGWISLQKHLKRSERWIVIEGQPSITIGNITTTYEINQVCNIPVGEMHRLGNETKKPVKIVEVQFGDYLGEDDIVRLEDIYGRKSEK